VHVVALEALELGLADPLRRSRRRGHADLDDLRRLGLGRGLGLSIGSGNGIGDGLGTGNGNGIGNRNGTGTGTGTGFGFGVGFGIGLGWRRRRRRLVLGARGPGDEQRSQRDDRGPSRGHGNTLL
jgi:hypothetical protein